MKITIEIDADEVFDIKRILDGLVEEYILTIQEAYGKKDEE